MKKEWELKSDDMLGIKKARCPCCGKGTFEFTNSDYNGILVNCESKGLVKIDNFWMPLRVCNNPLCEWSKIKEEVNAINESPKEAWEFYEKKH